MKKRSFNPGSPILLIFCTTLAITPPSSLAAPGTWNQTAADTAYSCTDTAN